MNAGANPAPPRYAGFWRRVLASLVDSVIAAALILPLLQIFYGQAVYDPAAPLILGPAHVVVTYVLPAVAAVLFWRFRGATPGKMLVGVRIVDADTGAPPSAAQCIRRYVGYFVSTLGLCLGFVWVAFDARKQGWHDKMANTVVIRSAATDDNNDDDEARWHA